jgi:uncharacterized membrane protein YccF (DUF307 family)
MEHSVFVTTLNYWLILLLSILKGLDIPSKFSCWISVGM